MHSLKVYYKPDSYPDWVKWNEFHQKFNLIGRPSGLGLGGIPVTRAGFAPRVSFGKPSNECDPTTNRRLRRGFDFQVRFVGTGHVEIGRFRLHAQRLVERSRALTQRSDT